MKHFKKAYEKIYRRFSFIVLTFSLFLIFSLLDYFLLTRTTSWERFLTDNNRLFVFLTINLGVLNNILIATALTFLVYIIEERQRLLTTTTNTVIGVFLSLISVGCAVCGGFLLPVLGIAASLTAFPFQGLEIKVLSIGLLLFSLREMSFKIAGVFSGVTSLTRSSKNAILGYSWVLGLVALILVYMIPRLPWQFKQNIFGSLVTPKKTANNTSGVSDNLFDQINPEAGYEINVSYGDLGPKMVSLGVIDLEKFKGVYQQAGQPLDEEKLTILTKGSNKKVRIDRQNSYFLLNFFWAAGLANKSKILTEGEITQYGKDQIGNFASIGGWTLAKGKPMNFYAKENLIPLTEDQEKLVEKVALKIYRPCCNNSTAFPDCNHGMALLAVLQLMAGNGANEKQMFEAAKYFNAYWFPGNYYDLALYFKNKEGKDFSQVPGEVILGKDYSSASGWQGIKKWLADKGLIKQPPKQGGGCGV
ncbi:MAG: hypothetical protein ACK4FL_02085 [Microgenomates group bacterium]